MSEKTIVSYKEFSKMDLHIRKIVEAEPVSQSGNLVRFPIDVGEGEIKHGVAGIALNNLQPKRIFGVQSDVMILAAEDETTISLLVPERPVKIGSQIK